MAKISLSETLFTIPKMDCPSEERIIRLRLEEFKTVKKLTFNIPQRELVVTHEGDPGYVLEALLPLNFGAQVKLSTPLLHFVADESDDVGESKLLKKLLLINVAMFLIELSIGLVAESMGLISDSLDMLADSGVYAISLYSVGKTLAIKKKSALTNGLFQLVLGTGIIIETIRRFIYGSDPEPTYMILVSMIALAANVYCLALLSKHKEGGVHMKASYICSSTDVMANAGVILAGVLVFLSNSPYPDLVIGIIVTGIVFRGALTILKLAR